MPHPLSHFLLLLLLSATCRGGLEPQNSNPLPSLYIPIGVGSTPDPQALVGGFGVFGEYVSSDAKLQFDNCGRKTLTTANPQAVDSKTGKATGLAIDIEISCEPSPDRIIVRADGTPVDFGTWPRNLTKECEMLTCSTETYPAGGVSSGKMDIDVYYMDNDPASQQKPEVKQVTDVDVNSAMPENPERTVCHDKKTQYSKTATGPYLITNEGQCFAAHNGLKTKLEDEQFMQVPRWIQKGEKVRNKRSTFFQTNGVTNLQRAPRPSYSFKSPTDLDGKEFKVCETACWHGPVYKYGMHEGMEYQMSITLDVGQCEAFRICFASKNHDQDSQIPNCELGKIIDVNVKSGIVSWPNEGRSSLIQFITPDHPASKKVIIEFGYGITINGVQRAEFYFGNMHREVVASSSTGFKTNEVKDLAFFFPKDNCLAESAGIFSKGISFGKVLTTKDKVVIEGGKYDKKALAPMNAPQNETVITTTTAAPIDFITTTSPAPPRAIPGVANLANPESVFESVAQSSAIYVQGKWWIWGVYIGFVVGTLLTLGIGAGLFYLLRRTVFGIWYKGMYKRYGCDVSGTTGGITGVGFGNTVTGDVTVQGTTGGTTVGGTTGGASTMGTTGGGTTGSTETSTLLDKTGGGETKSIAM